MNPRQCDQLRVRTSPIRRWVLDAVIIEFDLQNPLIAELADKDEDTLYSYAQGLAGALANGWAEDEIRRRFQALMAVLRHNGRLPAKPQIAAWHRLRIEGDWEPDEVRDRKAILQVG